MKHPHSHRASSRGHAFSHIHQRPSLGAGSHAHAGYGAGWAYRTDSVSSRAATSHAVAWPGVPPQHVADRPLMCANAAKPQAFTGATCVTIFRFANMFQVRSKRLFQHVLLRMFTSISVHDDKGLSLVRADSISQGDMAHSQTTNE